MTGFLAIAADFTFAKPMPPFAFKQVQSDGDTLEFFRRGDEYANYAETKDGYILVPCETDLCYADEAGESSNVRAHAAERRNSTEQDFLENLNADKARQKFLTEKMEKRERRPYGNFQKEFLPNGKVLKKPSAESWTLGSQTFLVILVNHQQKSWTDAEAKNFERQLNEADYSDNGHFGSVRDYYIKQSGGKFTPTFKVLGPYTYSGTVKGNDANVMKEVLAKASSAGDLTSFDGYAKNSDGTFVGLILAGSNADYDMEGITYMGWMCTEHSQGKVGRYVYIPSKESSDNETIDGMGTFAHEFGHVLGLPDLYQTSTDKGVFTTPGNYDVMDVGCYNGFYATSTGSVLGTHVPNMSSFEREWLGWHTPKTLSSADGVYSIPAYDSANFAYQIVDPSDSDQWFVLENRQLKNWDTTLPGHGLLIWHIDYDKSIWDAEGVNNGTQYVDIEEANTSEAAAYTFPGIKKVTEFDGFTNWSGQSIFSKISNITESNGYICFTVGDAELTSCPAGTTADTTTEQKIFTYAETVLISDSYSTTSIALGNVLTEFLGLSSSEMVNLLGSDLIYFSIAADGTRDTASTATRPGNWFDINGNSVKWSSESASVFSEIDLNAMNANVGNYPSRISAGESVLMQQGFSYGNKEAILKIQISFMESSGTAIPKLASGKDQRIFVGNRLSPFATASIQAGSRLEIYRLDGSLAKTFTDASEKNLSLSNGIFMAVLRNGSQIVLKEMFTVR